MIRFRLTATMVLLAIGLLIVELVVVLPRLRVHT